MMPLREAVLMEQVANFSYCVEQRKEEEKGDKVMYLVLTASDAPSEDIEESFILTTEFYMGYDLYEDILKKMETGELFFIGIRYLGLENANLIPMFIERKDVSELITQ